MYIKKYLIAIISLFMLCQCNDPYEDQTYLVYENYPISTYLETRSDEFSMWLEVLEKADMKNAVNQARMNFTMFVPNNAAMSAYYTQKGMSGVTDLSEEDARDLVEFHTSEYLITQSDMLSGGRLSRPMLSSDYLTISYGEEGSGQGGITSMRVNDEANIIELDNVATNGYVHVIDAVLTPISATLYDKLVENDDYSIFKEAVEMSGWQDRLEATYDTVVDDLGTEVLVKRNFTMLVVNNTVYNDQGIYSVGDLANLLEPESLLSDNEKLERYVGYHLIEGRVLTESLFAFDTDSVIIWNTMAENELVSTNFVGEQFNYINYDFTSQEGIGLIEGRENIAARNGFIHEIDAVMPVFSPEPATVIWDLTNYSDIASNINDFGAARGLGECYQQAQEGNSYKITLWKEEIQSYSWNVISSKRSTWPTVGYFLAQESDDEDDDLENVYGANLNDFLILSLGHFGTIEMKTPVLAKGRYRVELYYGYDASLADFIEGGSQCQFVVDDDISYKYLYSGIDNTIGTYSIALFDNIEFATTQQHNLEITLLDSRAQSHNAYRLMLDYVKFIPIVEEN